MKLVPTKINGLFIIEPQVYRDDRGYFFEIYRQDKFAAAGLGVSFVQDNRSYSIQGTIRGLHTQRRYPQAKLVSVVAGEVFDVVIDVRAGSPSFGVSESVILSSDNFRQFYVPEGLVHGFQVLSESAIVEYKCSELYHPEDELTLLWRDPDLAIQWPLQKVLVSKKDQAGLSWDEFKRRLALP